MYRKNSVDQLEFEEFSMLMPRHKQILPYKEQGLRANVGAGFKPAHALDLRAFCGTVYVFNTVLQNIGRFETCPYVGKGKT